jgi:hypothetical protein
MHKLSASDFVMAIEQTKRHKSSAIDKFLAELIKQELGQSFLRSVNVHNINQHKQTIR